MTPLELRIRELEEKLKVQKAKKQKLEAKKKKAEAKIKRSEDTRRKILVGAAVLASAARGGWARDKLQATLDAALTRPDDRALFDLPEVQI